MATIQAKATGQLTFNGVVTPSATVTETDVLALWPEYSDGNVSSYRSVNLGFLAQASYTGTLIVESSEDEAFTNPVALNDEADADFNIEADKLTMVPFPVNCRYVRIKSSGDESVNTFRNDEALNNTDLHDTETAEAVGVTEAAPSTSFAGTLDVTPIVPGTVSIEVGDAAPQVYTDPGADGILTDGAAGTGTVDYATGAITIEGIDAAHDDGEAVVATYDTWTSTYTDTVAEAPILEGSLIVTVGDATPQTFTDQGDGTLVGTSGGAGAVDYETGLIVLTGVLLIHTNGEAVTVDYRTNVGADKYVTYFVTTA